MTTGESLGDGLPTQGGQNTHAASRFDAPDAATASLVTILFADVISSTAQIAAMELEEAQELLDQAVARMRLRIRQYGGTIARVQGDGVMAIFGAPTPLEDHALRACCAANAMCEDFRALASGSNAQPEFRAIRVGIHSGRALIRTLKNDRGIDYDAVGPDVHFAAKVEELAPRNGAMLTSETLALAGSPVVAVAHGELTVAANRALKLFELKSLSFSPDIDRLLDQHGQAPFVGREEALQHLLDKIDVSTASIGGAIAIIGEAGIGKSRLVHEVARTVRILGLRVEEILGISVLRHTPFASLKPFIAGLLGCAANAQALEIKASARIHGVPADLLPGLFELLGVAVDDPAWSALAGPARRGVMFAAAGDVVERVVKRQPVLLLVEDVHHLDPETTDFLSVLHGLTSKLTLWLLITARPAARDSAARVASEVIDLAPLRTSEAKELCRFVGLAGAALHVAQIERVVERAAGNPFFLQELMRTPHAAAQSANDDEQTPLGIASLVQSRMAALSPQARRVIQAASILGGEIERPILAATARSGEGELQTILTELESQNLIDAANPNLIRFRHDLFRGGARLTLLKAEAAEIHGRAVLAFEARSSGTTENLERLAYHAERSGQIGKALTQLLNACRLGVRTSSQKTIRSLYDWAMRLKPSLPTDAKPVLLDLVMTSLDALQQSGDGAEYEKALQLAIDLSEASGERLKEGIARSHYAVFSWMGSRHAQARVHADIALQIAKETGVFALRDIAQSMTAHIEQATGELDQAIATYTDLLSAYTPETEHSTMGRMFLPSVRSCAFLSVFLVDRGRFADAQRTVDRGEAILGTLDQPYSRALITNAHGRLAMAKDEAAEAVRLLAQSHDICRKNQINVLEAGVAGWFASALVLAGDPEHARAVARYSVFNKLYLRAGRYASVRVFRGLAEAEFACGDIARALETATEAVKIATENQEPIHIAEARYARGLMLADERVGKIDSGREDLLAALAAGERIGLDPLAADCNAGLAKLAHRLRDASLARRHAEPAAALYTALGLTRRAAAMQSLAR